MYKVITFDNVTERVARHLGLDDPTKIKLTPHRCCSQQPIAPAIKYHGFDHLSEMLIHHNQKSDILYFEVLDIPPPLLEGLKTLNVSFHHAKKDTVIHRISLPSKSTFSFLQILEEEKNLGTRDCLVYVYHFIEDASETQKCSVVKTLVPMSLPKPTIS
ncbi:ubiquitin carboxyl-terminal hydrolase 13-like [Papaver somniferum]|uniref:ubiquitin carboxyl-terminal hydrolase 13-like n=2 Tax=Papaver somniferum TaxID=3469 RepID=UPI000E701053|nr:ubiquitin carboxyl-terminal hydrolase 13-like [Papaver somniferum]